MNKRLDPAHSFEPLLPTSPAPELDELAQEVCRRGGALKRSVHPLTATRIATLLQGINAYYSNRLGPEHPHSLAIEGALRRELEKEPGTSMQRLALAHIDTHREMETWLSEEPKVAVFGAAFLRRLHRSFYSRLTREDRLTRDGDELVPGELRQRNASVGKHVPPDWRAIEAFLSRAEEVYAGVHGPVRGLIAIACAHHRLAWVHPFRDGNGRVLRLQSQAALIQHGVGSGLWSVSRALGRDLQAYYDRLADADSPRRHDRDGRGNLSEQGLLAFAWHFLYGCLGEITAMTDALDPANLSAGVRAYLAFLSPTERDVPIEAAPALCGAFVAGCMPRDEFIRMTGLRAHTADKAVETLLRRGLLQTDATGGSFSIGLPVEALNFYFPRLLSGEETSTSFEGSGNA